MTIEIEPKKEQIDNWIKQYLPDKDLFFIEEKDLSTFGDYLQWNISYT